MRTETAAGFCGVHRKTILEWGKRGLRLYRIGKVVLVKRAELVAFIEGGQTGAI